MQKKTKFARHNPVLAEMKITLDRLVLHALEMGRKLDAATKEIGALASRLNTPPPASGSEALTVPLFLAELKRHGLTRSKDWLYDQLGARKIKRLAVGRPYAIPRSEVLRVVAEKGGL